MKYTKYREYWKDRQIKDKELTSLKNEVYIEMENIEDVILEINEFLVMIKSGRIKRYHLRAAASMLQDFYSGIENILIIIIREFEGLPKSDECRRSLLLLSAREIDSVRPPILNEELIKILDEYMRFRYLFLHSYDFELKWDKIKHLVEGIDDLWEKISSELDDFLEFLDDIEV